MTKTQALAQVQAAIKLSWSRTTWAFKRDMLRSMYSGEHGRLKAALERLGRPLFNFHWNGNPEADVRRFINRLSEPKK